MGYRIHKVDPKAPRRAMCGRRDYLSPCLTARRFLRTLWWEHTTCPSCLKKREGAHA